MLGTEGAGNAASAGRPVRDNLAAGDIAAILFSTDRSRPVVVVSAWGEGTSVDAVRLAERLGDDAEVISVMSGPATWELKELLPPELGVFGDAVRVYPADLAWTLHPPHCPLYVVQRPEDAGQIIAAVKEDVAAFGGAAPLPVADVPPARPSPRTGTVKGFIARSTRALVVFPDGGSGTIREESLGYGVPLSWLLRPGQEIAGEYDSASLEFRLRPCTAPLSVRTLYPSGGLALALVNSVAADSTRVTLFPGAVFTMQLADISSNELDAADDLLTAGEVVTVRVRYRLGAVHLSMIDVDDDEPHVAAPALVEGGTPWLEPDRHLAAALDVDGGIAVPPALPSFSAGAGADGSGRANSQPEAGTGLQRSALTQTQLALDAARARISVLEEHLAAAGSADSLANRLQSRLAAAEDQLQEVHAELHAAKARARRYRDELTARSQQAAELRRKLRNARATTPGSRLRKVFSDPEEQLRHELFLAWTERVPRESKDNHPLAEYRLGPEFLESLRGHPEEKQAKALRAIVDLLAGPPERLAPRGPHVLRQELSGGSPAVTRNDGTDTCWRLSVEHTAPAARRLHYWKCSDGTIELSRVVLHDDYKP
jgi:hypothetical protein